MRISSTRVDRALQQQAPPVNSVSRSVQAEKTKACGVRAYEITLSTTALEVAVAHRAAAESPAVRTQRVAAIRTAVARGVYVPNSHDIAQKIMEAIGLAPRSP